MWTKLSDEFFRNPKVVAAGRDARDLYLVSLCHCNEHLTDGFIAQNYLRRMAADAEIDSATEAAARLVEVGLWDIAVGGYVVHDFAEYNPSKAEVEEERRKKAERQEKWRQSRNASRNASQDESGDASKDDAPVPVPVPDVTKVTSTSSPKPPRDARQAPASRNQDDVAEPALALVASEPAPVGKPFKAQDEIPQFARELLTGCPDYWEDHLRLALVGRAPSQVASYACAVVREWRRGKNPPTAPLPAPGAPTLPRMSREAEERIDRALNMHRLHNEFEEELFPATTTKGLVQ